MGFMWGFLVGAIAGPIMLVVFLGSNKESAGAWVVNHAFQDGVREGRRQVEQELEEEEQKDVETDAQ